MRQLLWNTLIILLCFLGVIACSEQHQHDANLSGQQLYDLHCASCHQASGKGKFLKGVPPSKYTLLTTDELIEKITQGSQQQSKMEIFESMSKDEAEKIADYVKYTLRHKNE